MGYTKSRKSNNRRYFYHKKSRLRSICAGFIHKLIAKSREPFTVMFIPHSEKKIFNFQIAHITFIMLIGIVLAIAVVGSLSYFKSNKMNKGITEDQKQILQKISDLNQYIKITPKIRKEVDNFYDFTEQVLMSCSLKHSVNFKNMGGPVPKGSVINPKALQKNYNSLRVTEIKELANLSNKLKLTQNKIQGISQFLKGHRKILATMPSIFPIFGGGYIVSSFGWRRDPFTYALSEHSGLDIINTPRTPIQATADGVIIHAENGGSRGLYVEIQHQFGLSTQYLHMDKLYVKRGDIVKRGKKIGELGNTGRSTGYHLHYEVRINGRPVNPAKYLTLDKYAKGK